MNRIEINGVIFESAGTISIINGRVSVGGKQLTEVKETLIRIEVHGDLTSLTTDSSVTVHGNVTGNVDAGGSIQCESVGGDADAGGSIQCGNVGGSVDAGGSVIAKTIMSGSRL
jgi:hypothetical protein